MPTFVSAAKWIPEAVQRLCGFHVGQAMWRWLWNAKNGIIFEDRQEIIKRFMPLLRSPTENVSNTLYESLIESDTAKRYPNLLKHLAGK